VIFPTLAEHQKIPQMKKSEKQPEVTQPKTKVCTKCNIEKPIEDFRIHGSSGFVLNQCRICEKEIALARARMKKGNPIPAAATPTTFIITNRKGKEFLVSLEPTPGCRKVTNGEHTLYFPVGTSKDEGRSAFVKHFGCSMNGVSTQVVE
jgi:hypothetical protein